MARGTEYQCSPMVLDSLIQVGPDTSLLESNLKTDGKVVER
jgi:hypothetical protein